MRTEGVVMMVVVGVGLLLCSGPAKTSASDEVQDVIDLIKEGVCTLVFESYWATNKKKFIKKCEKDCDPVAECDEDKLKDNAKKEREGYCADETKDPKWSWEDIPCKNLKGWFIAVIVILIFLFVVLPIVCIVLCCIGCFKR